MVEGSSEMEVVALRRLSGGMVARMKAPIDMIDLR